MGCVDAKEEEEDSEGDKEVEGGRKVDSLKYFYCSG